MKGEGHSKFWNMVEGVPLQTYRKFKGLENGFIIIVDAGYDHFVDRLLHRAFYTALTRAKFGVVVIVDDIECAAKTKLTSIMGTGKITKDRLRQHILIEKFPCTA